MSKSIQERAVGGRNASPAAKLVIHAFAIGLLLGAALFGLASALIDPPHWTVTLLL